MARNPYQILQVSQVAEQEVIEAAYKSLARKYHPDINSSPEAMERMKEINGAYRILSDPTKREVLDKYLAGNLKPPIQNPNTTQPKYSKNENINIASTRANDTALSRCQNCGIIAPTKQVKFKRHVGVIVLRYMRSIEGKLCKVCINEYFWKFTAITLFLGWWGIISFIVTPFYLLENVGNYIPTIGMSSGSILRRKSLGVWFSQFIVIGFFLVITAGILLLLIDGNYSTPLNCIRWSDVSMSDIGKHVCVYGEIKKIETTNQYAQIIRFSNTGGSFVLLGENSWYDRIYIGRCIAAKGKVFISKERILAMDSAYTILDDYWFCSLQP